MSAAMPKRLETWDSRWVEGRTNWHISDVHPQLIKFAGELLPGSTGKTVFIPLCGKTIDMKWLYDNGHTVIGVEGVELPILEFFQENGLELVKDETNKIPCFKTPDNRIQIYHGDLFALDVATIGKVDAVWDRGSLVAIYEEDRDRYAALLKSLLAPDFRYLVAVMIYIPTEEFSGPPRSVPHDELQRLFGSIADMRELEILDYSHRGWTKDIHESFCLLTPK